MRYIRFWGVFETLTEAKRERSFAENAIFHSWIVTGELLEFEMELSNYWIEQIGGYLIEQT